MKKFLFLLLIFSFAINPLPAQKKKNKKPEKKIVDTSQVTLTASNPLDSILSVYFQRTNLNKFNEIKSIEIEGDMEVLNDVYSFRLQYKPPHFFRMKERFNSQWVYRIINGHEMKVITKHGIIDISQQEIDVMYNLISFLKGFLTDYDKNQFKLTYLRTDTISYLPDPPKDPSKPLILIPYNKIPKGKHHIIELITPTGEEDKIYINAETMNITLASENPFMFAKLGPVKFDLYESIDGYIFPKRIEMISQVFPAVFRLYEIRLNKEFPETYFQINSEENKWVPDDN